MSLSPEQQLKASKILINDSFLLTLFINKYDSLIELGIVRSLDEISGFSAPDPLIQAQNILLKQQHVDSKDILVFNFLDNYYGDFFKKSVDHVQKTDSFENAIKGAPSFGRIKSSAGALLKLGMNIHVMAWRTEFNTSRTKHPVPLISISSDSQLSASLEYKSHFKRMAAIYANDLDAFETYLCETSSLKILFLSADADLWESIFKAYEGNTERLLRLVEKDAEKFSTTMLGNPLAAHMIMDAVQKEKIDLFTSDFTNIRSGLLIRSLFDNRHADIFDRIFHKKPTQEVQATIHVNIENIITLAHSLLERDAAGNWTIASSFQDRYFNLLTSLLTKGEKYEIQDLTHSAIAAFVPPTILQQYIDQTGHIDIIIRMHNHDFGEPEINKSMAEDLLQYTHHGVPILLSALYHKHLTPDAFLETLEKYIAMGVSKKEVFAQLALKPGSQEKPNAPFDAFVLKHFADDRNSLKTWLATYKDSINKLNILHTLYGTKLKSGKITDEELGFLRTYGMGTRYLRTMSNGKQPYLDVLTADQFRRLSSENILPELFAGSKTQTMKWVFDKNPDLFNEWLRTPDATGNMPIQQASANYAAKIPSWENGLGECMRTYLQESNVALKQKERLARTTEETPKKKESSPPMVPAHPIPKIQAPAETLFKEIAVLTSFKKDWKRITNPKWRGYIRNEIRYLLSPEFTYIQSNSEQRTGYGDLSFTDCAGKRIRLGFYPDFSKKAIVLLSVKPREGSYRESDLKVRHMQEDAKSAAQKLQNNPRRRLFAHERVRPTVIENQRDS